MGRVAGGMSGYARVFLAMLKKPGRLKIGVRVSLFNIHFLCIFTFLLQTVFARMASFVLPLTILKIQMPLVTTSFA